MSQANAFWFCEYAQVGNSYVLSEGFEPPIRKEYAPKAYAYANSATRAFKEAQLYQF